MKVIILFLFINISYCQSGIVASGHDSYTVGAGLVELQIEVINEVTLSVPKFEKPIEKPIVITKKKSLIEKILDFIKKVILN